MKPSNINEEILDTRMFNPKSPYLLTVKDAAKTIGIPTWSMRTRIWRGEVPVIRFKGEKKQYVDLRDLLKLIDKVKETVE